MLQGRESPGSSSVFVIGQCCLQEGAEGMV